MQRIVERDRCNGCEACQAVCPKKAISMIRDEDGFYFPSINEDLCINCGVCGKVCPAENKIIFRKIDYNDTLAYGGYDKNPETLHRSSSGGFFGVLAKYILDKNGVVYGVVFSEDYRSVFFSNTDETSLAKMRGSKYVTARKNNIYGHVKDSLLNGRNVLFVGLPCEISALYSILKKDYDNLLTCELICAGASSYNLLDAQLDWLEKKYNGKATYFSFRYKKYGWVPCAIYYRNNNEKKYAEMFDKTIFGVGMKYAKRQACFNCKFKGLDRVADFTIGDFWNINRSADYYNEEGTSVIFARTKKALQYMEQLSDFKKTKVKAEVAQKSNMQQLKYPAGVPDDRENYLKCLREEGGIAAFRKYRPKPTFLSRVKNSMPVFLYKFLRRVETRFHL